MKEDSSSSSVLADIDVQPLGPQPLRGLDHPLPLYQVLPRALAHRRFFAALRLDVHVDDLENSSAQELTTLGDGTGTNSLAVSSSQGTKGMSVLGCSWSSRRKLICCPSRRSPCKLWKLCFQRAAPNGERRRCGMSAPVGASHTKSQRKTLLGGPIPNGSAWIIMRTTMQRRRLTVLGHRRGC